ncbi:ribosomal protein S20 [gamma proteobacterium NOR5-3]|nr:ribosomal protein S20 [gamma proteobacterium NOR5-3]
MGAAARLLTDARAIGRIRPPKISFYLFHYLEESYVANSPQARKRARQSEKRRSHNASLRSLVRTNIKNVLAAVKTGDAEQALAAYTKAVPVIDRMADKGIIHKNKAARHKSRLNAQVKALAA